MMQQAQMNMQGCYPGELAGKQHAGNSKYLSARGRRKTPQDHSRSSRQAIAGNLQSAL
jgi:hypothetical protein